LGVGELAAITLAEQLHADLLLMDDLDGRIEAERRHLKAIGTLGVLRDAALHQLIDLPQALDQLRQTNFFVSPEVLQSLLAGLRKPEA
jgi:predicted nucleic acid-binding protein